MIRDKGRESVYLREETVRAKIVCSCAGGLVEPNAWPESIPGKDEFEGHIFHSARWDYNISLKDKDVVVVGTGCSAAQFLPLLKAKTVTQLMRSPPWVVPRPIPPFGEEAWAKHSPWYFKRIPGLFRLFRSFAFLLTEIEFFKMF